MPRSLTKLFLLGLLSVSLWTCSSSSETTYLDASKDQAAADLVGKQDTRPGDTLDVPRLEDLLDTGKDSGDLPDLKPELELPGDTQLKDTEILPDTPEQPDLDVAQPDLEEVGIDTYPDTIWPDTIPETCEPDCTDRQCGSDGCFSVCGFCAYGELCNPSGRCVMDVCPINCTKEDGSPKQCGPDTCGGYCGFCPSGLSCGADGSCYSNTCSGSCAGKSCGLDGCGGVCGYCGPGKLCTDAGQCIDHPCGEVTEEGICNDKYSLERCVDLAVVATNCHSVPNGMCGWDTENHNYNCIEEAPCQAVCMFGDGTVKECGTDSCWGACGVCPLGWACNQGKCKPAPGAECSYIDDQIGACFGNVRWFCSDAKLNGYDCFVKEGKSCGWDPSLNGGTGGLGCI